MRRRMEPLIMVARMLENKVVIVTGIGPGFGRVLAREAANLGAKVCMVSRSTDVMNTVQSEILSFGGEAICVQSDITDPDACRNVAAKAVDAFGRIDGLVNSAYRPGMLAPVIDLDGDDLKQSFEVTVIGTLNMIKAVVPKMKEQKGGAIINIGSQVSRKIVHDQGGYASTKAALSALTRYLASELGEHGIRVNTPAFGWTIGPPARAWLEQQEAEGGPTVKQSIDGIAATISLKRVPEEVECAHAALTLISDQMKVVTGATLDVNGGDYLPL